MRAVLLHNDPRLDAFVPALERVSNDAPLLATHDADVAAAALADGRGLCVLALKDDPGMPALVGRLRVGAPAAVIEGLPLQRLNIDDDSAACSNGVDWVFPLTPDAAGLAIIVLHQQLATLAERRSHVPSTVQRVLALEIDEEREAELRAAGLEVVRASDPLDLLRQLKNAPARAVVAKRGATLRASNLLEAAKAFEPRLAFACDPDDLRRHL